MTVTLFTGVPKAGKTLMAVSRLYSMLKKDPDRPVYCDIRGLKVEGIESPPDDWSSCPDGSLIIYDEVQYREPYRRARGATKHQYILDLTTHAHRGIDIWLITQSPTFLHSDVLECVGEHIHLRRPNNMAFSHYLHWGFHQKSPNGVTARRECESKGIVRHSKDMFALYQSVQVDDDKANHKKFKFTSGMITTIVIILVCLAVFIWGLMPKGDDKKIEQQATDSNTQSLVSTAVAPAPSSNMTTQSPEQLELQRVAMVVASDSGCIAKNSRGQKLDISASECFSYSNDVRNFSSSYIEQNNQFMGDLGGINDTEVDAANTDTSTSVDNPFNTNPI